MEKFKNHTTQRATILAHLKKHKRITTMEAFSLYNITRLSEYIRVLRTEGFTIPSVDWKINPNTGNRYGVYRFIKPKNRRV